MSLAKVLNIGNEVTELEKEPTPNPPCNLFTDMTRDEKVAKFIK